MKVQNNKQSSLRELLTRFIDSSRLTPALIADTQYYLFEDGNVTTHFIDEEFSSVVVYLKDIMEINHLLNIDDILWYYEQKKDRICNFIDNVQLPENCDHMNAVQIEIMHDINWKKSTQQVSETISMKRTCCRWTATYMARHDMRPLKKDVTDLSNFMLRLDAVEPRCEIKPVQENEYIFPSLKNKSTTIMAKNGNSGDGHRNGQVDKRSQVLNPKTELYVKRDTKTGKFMEVKTSGGKFKGVRKEK